MNRMSSLWGAFTTITFVALAPVFADNHDNPGNPTVAMQAHYCTLNSGKDMADVDQALAPWRRWKEETNWNGWTAELTPQFDIADGPDFYWLNFAPFDYTGDVLEEFAVSGGEIQRGINSVASCKVALYASKLKYPPVEESTLNETKVVVVESCSAKDGVNMDTMLARHADFVETSKNNNASFLWNIVWPLAGVPPITPLGTERRDFAHMVWYNDVKSLMQAYDAETNGGGMSDRRDYLQNYADCDGRNTYNVNILSKPSRPWR